MRNDSDTYELVFVLETEKAIGVRKEDDEETFFLPKSQIEYEENPQKGELIDVEIPDWLAIEKDL